MKTAVIGLGLIGGSIAKAYKSASLNEVYGYDKDPSTLSYAKLSETIDDVLTDELLTQCELVFIALYPGDTVDFLQKKASYFRKGAVVIDTCGVKRGICEVGFDLAKRFGFTFVGGHPMAGTQFSGIKHSRADLFNGASMVIVPPDFGDIALLDKIKQFLFPLQLGKITISTAEHHDDVIAYTSQLAHIVSSAYIKNKNAENAFSFCNHIEIALCPILFDPFFRRITAVPLRRVSVSCHEFFGILVNFKNLIQFFLFCLPYHQAIPFPLKYAGAS